VSYPFDPERGRVVVQAEVFGPSGSIVLRLALDTGATGTLINVAMLTAVGYDPSLAPDRVQVTTGSGVEFAPRIAVARMAAMGQEHSHFPVLAHTLPPSASVDGLLGLDFLRGQVVNIDFRQGNICFT
jgi:predicted aspartyl protease